MIARAHRFHGYGSLRHVYARGQVVRGPWFALKYLKNDRRKTYRAAVVVSKKVHKSAIVRNRIRRRLYEALRLQLPKDLPPYDIVLIVYSESVADTPATELHAQVASQLKKAKLIA